MGRQIGFTGTQRGMTGDQLDRVWRLLVEFAPGTIHHGDCIGADEQIHSLAVVKGRYYIVIHPPSDAKKRAWCTNFTEARPEKPYLQRNGDIVAETTLLIACPDGYNERIRSGTWVTVRCARRMGRSIVIVRPDGTTSWEGGKPRW